MFKTFTEYIVHMIILHLQKMVASPKVYTEQRRQNICQKSLLQLKCVYEQ